MKKCIILVSVLLLVMFTGCSSPFLEKEFVVGLDKFPKTTTKLIYFQSDYNYLNPEKTTETTHLIIKVGADRKDLVRILQVTNSSVEELLAYNARILRAGKVEQSYAKGDLNKFSLSSSYSISESFMLFLSIENDVAPGDIIEIVTQHKLNLPQLGFTFSEPSDMLSAAQVICNVILPQNKPLQYQCINHKITPKTTNIQDGSIQYSFTWNATEEKRDPNPFDFRSKKPSILIAYHDIKDINPFTWQNFGKWYRELAETKMKPAEKIQKLSAEITAGLNDDLQKMNAIYNYCQNKIRYEQVYFSLGEFIPNDCNMVLERGYGDCKDYATLMKSFADCANLKTSLALCYRGRGDVAFTDIPVSQFNHVILHMQYNGTDYWYDGTNRSGIPGVTTSDLLNQKALVMGSDSSRIVTIKEDDASSVTVSGDLQLNGNDLKGDVRFQLRGQYAVDFFFIEFSLNKNKLLDYLGMWIRENFNSSITTSNISYEKKPDGFDIIAKLSIPNTVTRIDNTLYNSLSQTFPNTLPVLPHDKQSAVIAYYPGPSRVNINITLGNLAPVGTNSSTPYTYNYSWHFNPGPFNDLEKSEFLKSYSELKQQFTTKHKLVVRESK